jgi:hypothetical protein
MCKGPIAAGKPSAQDNFATNVLGVNPNAKAGTPQSNGAAPPTNPFTTQKVEVEVDKLGIEIIKRLTMDRAQDAYTDYKAAFAKAVKWLDKAIEQAKKQAQTNFDIAVSMALVVLTPLTAGAAAAVLKGVLTAKDTFALELAQKAQTIMTKTGSTATAEMLAKDILDAATNESVGRLVKAYTTSDAIKIVSSAMTSFSKKVSIPGHTDTLACTLSYMWEMEKAAALAKDQFNKFVETSASESVGQLLQLYHSFDPENRAKYPAQLEEQSRNFEKNVAPTIVQRARLKAEGQLSPNPNQLYDGENLVKMDAYGRIRYAKIHFQGAHHPLTSPTPSYRFISWVPRDAEEAAAALNPRLLDPNLIYGHIPNPGVP